jgi:hypothetical protein
MRALGFVTALLVTTVASADDAIDRLVRLVGRDAGLCVEIPHLDETLSAFEHGEFFKRFERSHLYAKWKASSDYDRIEKMAAGIENFSGKPLRQFLRDIFGTGVVVAVYSEPGPGTAAVLMTEAASAEVLKSEIEAWNRSVAHRTEPVDFSGHTYFRRTCEEKVAQGPQRKTVYYCVLDKTFLLSDHEDLIRRSLTRASSKEPDGSLFDVPAYRDARQSLSPSYSARAYVNPRIWEGLFAQAHRPGDEVHRSALAVTFLDFWRRCDWLAVGLQTDRGIVVEATARYATTGLSDRWKSLIGSLSGSADFLSLVPSDALCVLAGRQAFGDLLRQSIPHSPSGAGTEGRSWDSFRQVSRGLLLGLDLFDDVLPAFRENWGAYLAPRRGAKPHELPVEGVAAIELPPLPSTPSVDRKQPAVRDAIDNGLNMGLNFIAAYFNMSSTGNPAVVRTEPADAKNPRLRWIESIGAYQPACALTSRFLVFATTPGAIRTFVAAESAAAGKGLQHPVFARLAKRYFPKENQILFVDAAGISAFVREHGQQLIQQAVRCRSLDPSETEKTVRGLLDVAALFDAVFAAGRLENGSIRIVAGGVVEDSVSLDAKRSQASHSAKTVVLPARSSQTK